MAQKQTTSAGSQARTQNEAELARLRQLRRGLPPDRRTAGAAMDRRIATLETALRAGPRVDGGARKALGLFGVLAMLGLALGLGFAGMVVAGRLAGF